MTPKDQERYEALLRQRLSEQLPADGEGHRHQVHPMPVSRRACRDRPRRECIARGSILRLSVN